MVGGHSLRMKLLRVDYETQSSRGLSDAAYVAIVVIAAAIIESSFRSIIGAAAIAP